MTLRELRCPKCHGLLFKESIIKGYVEIKCYHKDPTTRKACGEVVKATFVDHRDAKPKRQNAKISTGA